MRALLVGLLVALAACGDSTGPQITCEAEKRAELAALFGADYNPTPELLQQDHWTFGATEVTWTQNCAMTVH